MKIILYWGSPQNEKHFWRISGLERLRLTDLKEGRKWDKLKQCSSLQMGDELVNAWMSFPLNHAVVDRGMWSTTQQCLLTCFIFKLIVTLSYFYICGLWSTMNNLFICVGVMINCTSNNLYNYVFTGLVF